MSGTARGAQDPRTVTIGLVDHYIVGGESAARAKCVLRFMLGYRCDHGARRVLLLSGAFESRYVDKRYVVMSCDNIDDFSLERRHNEEGRSKPRAREDGALFFSSFVCSHAHVCYIQTGSTHPSPSKFLASSVCIVFKHLDRLRLCIAAHTKPVLVNIDLVFALQSKSSTSRGRNTRRIIPRRRLRALVLPHVTRQPARGCRLSSARLWNGQTTAKSCACAQLAAGDQTACPFVFKNRMHTTFEHEMLSELLVRCELNTRTS
jgi:hypothetical protein